MAVDLVSDMTTAGVNLIPGFTMDLKTVFVALIALEFIVLAVDAIIVPMLQSRFGGDEYSEYERKREKRELFARTYESKHNSHDFPPAPKIKGNNHLGI